MPEPKPAPPHEGPPPPPPSKHGPSDVPPHILKELLELREKVGRLEGMMEVILQHLHK